ncbi:Cyclin-dependent kinase 2 like protein [Plasmodiophora brassicae]
MENYDSFGTIGEGTYGIVLKARHKITGQIVAIKKFKESDENEQVRKTALREIRILKQLKHENVVELLEVFRRKGKLYLVFEHVERTILEDLDTHPNGLPPLEVKRCLYQLLKSLEFCHAHKIIHRDIKPENLLISRDGIVKLCDFGFARTTARPGAKYTDYVATRWYRSPELLVGDTEYGKPVDIWAVGCMFAEILNGVPLFPGESDLDQLFQIMKCLGKLTPHQRELFYKNPMYVGVKLPEITKQVTLEAKFPKLEKNALMLMHQCLEYEPANRGTCTDLLRHPYFDGFAQQWEEDRARECNSEDGSRKKSKRDTAPKPAKKAAAAAQRSNHTPISQEAEKMFRALKDSMHGEQQKEGKERSWKSQWDAENTPDERAAPMNNAASDKQKRAVKNGMWQLVGREVTN